MCCEEVQMAVQDNILEFFPFNLSGPTTIYSNSLSLIMRLFCGPIEMPSHLGINYSSQHLSHIAKTFSILVNGLDNIFHRSQFYMKNREKSICRVHEFLIVLSWDQILMVWPVRSF